MKKITAYKISDGSIIEDEEIAIETQKYINLQKNVKSFCREYLSSHQTIDVIVDEICNHIEELKHIIDVYT